MPDFTYRGQSPGMYPMLRDAYDVPAGTVKPGDVLRFAQAPDADWVYLDPAEAERAEADRLALAEAVAELTARPDSGGVQGVQGVQAEQQPDGEPGGEQDDNDAGESGSEEN